MDGRNDLVWSAMQYQCRRCLSIEWIYLGVGVEGPQQLRDRGLYIASPPAGPACLKCKGPTSHVNWNQDRIFPPQDAKGGFRYFRVPPKWTPDHLSRFESIVFAGDTVVAPLVV